MLRRLAFTLALALTWLSPPAYGQEPEVPERIPIPPQGFCYLISTLTEEADSSRGAWVTLLCPAGQTLPAPIATELWPAIEEIMDEADTPARVRERAKRWMRLSGHSLEELACWGVGEIRWASAQWLPREGVDPNDSRNRSAKEISEWLRRSAEVHGGPEARALAEIVFGDGTEDHPPWPAQGVKQAHDRLKPLLGDLCPR